MPGNGIDGAALQEHGVYLPDGNGLGFHNLRQSSPAIRFHPFYTQETVRMEG